MVKIKKITIDELRSLTFFSFVTTSLIELLMALLASTVS